MPPTIEDQDDSLFATPGEALGTKLAHMYTTVSAWPEFIGPRLLYDPIPDAVIEDKDAGLVVLIYGDHVEIESDDGYYSMRVSRETLRKALETP